MVLDSSALVSVLLEEKGSARVLAAMAAAEQLSIGAPTLVEADLVMTHRFDLHGRALLAQLLERGRVLVLPFDERHRRVAAQAFIRFGKGRHPAGLNYGDCMTYATARVADHPLLFTGEDFAKTDVAAALA